MKRREFRLELLWTRVAFCTFSLAGLIVVQGATDGGLGEPGLARPKQEVVMPPAIPSPVATFRKLLTLSAGERAELLVAKPEAQRRYIEAKVREYETLRPEERELRLRLVQLHWYLMPLLRTPGSNRVEQLKAVPEPDRQMIRDRLAKWDGLPEELRKQILEYEPTMQRLISLNSPGATDRQAAGGSLGPQERSQLEAKLAKWKALGPEDRQGMLGYFQQFFDLPEKEKAKTLGVLSDNERREMQETLLAFQRLPPPQRQLCIESFHRFAAMSGRERMQFLRNAERWQAMTPTERNNWRKVVAQLPPLPPEFGMPPMPPARAKLGFTTNGVAFTSTNDVGR